LKECDFCAILVTVKEEMISPEKDGDLLKRFVIRGQQ
jgi:hypothetical protein